MLAEDPFGGFEYFGPEGGSPIPIGSRLFIDPGSLGAVVGGAVSLPGAVLAFDEGTTVGTIVAAGAALAGAPVAGAAGAVARGAADAAGTTGFAAGALVAPSWNSAGTNFIGRASTSNSRLNAITRKRALATPHVLRSSIFSQSNDVGAEKLLGRDERGVAVLDCRPDSQRLSSRSAK